MRIPRSLRQLHQPDGPIVKTADHHVDHRVLAFDMAFGDQGDPVQVHQPPGWTAAS
jgi:hypothetical protein